MNAEAAFPDSPLATKLAREIPARITNDSSAKSARSFLCVKGDSSTLFRYYCTLLCANKWPSYVIGSLSQISLFSHLCIVSSARRLLFGLRAFCLVTYPEKITSDVHSSICTHSKFLYNKIYILYVWLCEYELVV